MDNPKQKVFESTAFEILDHNLLNCYDCDFEQSGADKLKENIAKHIDVLFFVKENNRLVFFTNKKIEEPSISFMSHGEKIEVVLTDLQWPADKKLRIFMMYAMNQNENILKVSKELYFLPFEGFYTIMKKDEKNKIYPFFTYEIFSLETKVLIVFKIILYSQIYPNLKRAIEEEHISKTNTLNQLIVPLFNYKVNFLVFENEATADEVTDLSYFEQFVVQENNTSNFVRLRHLDDNETLVAPAVNFNLLNRLEFSTFIQEKIYMLLKLRKVIGGSDFMKKSGLRFDNTTFKPDLLASRLKSMLKFELHVRPDDAKLSDWIFMCNKADMEMGGKLVKDISMTIKNVFKLENFKPPKAYSVSLKEDQTLESSFLEGLQNKLTDEVSLVVILINIENPRIEEVEQYLINNNKKYIIFEAPLLVSQQNYFQSKVDNLYVGLASKYEGRLSRIAAKLRVSFSVLKETYSGKYLYTTKLHIDDGKLDISREIVKVVESSDLQHALTNRLDNDFLSFHFFITATESTFKTNGVGNQIFVIVSESNFSIFPNVAINSYYADTLLNFQNYRNLVTQERFFADKNEEECFERCFVYSKLDRYNMVIMDYLKSYRLSFVDGLSETHLPIIEGLFLLIKSIRGDFAYFFK